MVMKGFGENCPLVCQRTCRINAHVGVGDFRKDEVLGTQH